MKPGVVKLVLLAAVEDEAGIDGLTELEFWSDP